MSTKNDSKFQYISCVTEEEHPPIEDVKVNVVVRNQDGTFFNVVGESIVTHESKSKNSESKEVALINDTPMTPAQNQVLEHNETSSIDFNHDFKISSELKPLETTMTKGEDGEEEMNTTNSYEEDKEYEILSVQPGVNVSLCILQPSSKLVFKMGASSYEIDYVLPKEQYSQIVIERQGDNLNVTIKNDELSGESYTQILSVSESDIKNDEFNGDETKPEYYLCGPASEPASRN